ncbi:MaoC family dehydratase [Actinopolymorpha pittospori]
MSTPPHTSALPGTAVPGVNVSFRKTLSESDVYLFAGVTGDFSPNHVDEEFMKGTPYGGRIAHGALLVGLTSRASTMMIEHLGASAVSYGYDRIRFLRGVRIGTTLTVTYTLTRVDEEACKTFADVTVTDQDGALCAVAEHILKFFTTQEG